MTIGGDIHRQRAGVRSARAVVHELLRRQIVGLQLAPGQPLSESDLAARLGVSRTPVRESLILLADEGLVEVVPQVGTFVSRIRESDAASAQFVREALERAALTAGGAEIPDAELHALRENLAAQDAAATAEDHDRFFQLDDAFHAALMAATGHAAAWPIVAEAKSQLDRARRLSLSLTQRPRLLAEQHGSIVDRLDEGDVAGADRALRDHLRLVFGDIATIRAQHPEMFEDDAAPGLRQRRSRS